MTRQSLFAYMALVFYLSFMSLGCTEKSPEPASRTEVFIPAGFELMLKNIVTSRGDYVICGVQHEAPAILCLDSNFNQRFSISLDKFGYGVFQDVIETTDGDFVLVGYTLSEEVNANQDNPKSIAVKLNANGDLIWDKTYDVNDSHEQWLTIAETSQGGFVLGGEVSGQPFAGIMRIDANGNSIDTSAQTIRMKGIFRNATSDLLVEDNDDVVAINVTTMTSDFIRTFRPSFYRFKSGLVDSTAVAAGVVMPNFAKYPYNSNVKSKIVALPDGYVAACQFEFAAPTYYYKVMRLTKDFELVWEKDFKGQGITFFEDMMLSNEKLMILGRTSPSDAIPNLCYSVVLDLDGTLLWEHTYGGIQRHETGLTARFVDNTYRILGGSFGLNSIVLFQYALDTTGNLITN